MQELGIARLSGLRSRKLDIHARDRAKNAPGSLQTGPPGQPVKAFTRPVAASESSTPVGSVATLWDARRAKAAQT